jgi:hypothetical protein
MAELTQCQTIKIIVPGFCKAPGGRNPSSCRDARNADLRLELHLDNADQNVPSTARVAAGAFGFLTLIQVFDGPDR